MPINSCANDGDHTKHTKQCQEYIFTWWQSSCQLLDALPFNTPKIPARSTAW